MTQPRSVARTVIRDGREWIEVDMAKFIMPKDWTPDSGMYLLIAPPAGGIGGFAALAKGDPGYSPTFVVSSTTTLDAGEDAVVSSTLLAPATEVAGPLYGLDFSLPKGADGDPGAAEITPSDYGETPTIGQALTVASGGTDFELTWPKRSKLYYPASVTAVPGGTGGSATNCATVNISSGTFNFDYKCIPFGTCQIAGSSTSLRVDLVARYNAVDGDEIGRAYGMSGQNDRLTLTPSPVAGAADSVGKTSAGDGCLVYFNTERQSGSATYSASSSYMKFGVLVVPA